MPMRVTGLTSGLDTESIISALVSSYNMKSEKYTKAQTKITWAQDAWKGLNTKVYSLYTNLSNLRFSSAYATKKASVSDITKASVTASGEAVNGTQKLKINSTAQSAYMTGGKMKLSDITNKEGIKSDTTLKELGYTGGKTSFSVTVNGEKKDIEISGDSKITDVVAKFKEAGLNANFDTAQSRLYISAKESGKAGDFKIEPNANYTDAYGTVQQYNSDSFGALFSLGLASTEMAEKVYKPVSATDLYLTSAHTDSNVRISFATPDSKAMADEQNNLIKELKAEGGYSVTATQEDDGTVTATYAATSGNYIFENGKIYASYDAERANVLATYEELTADLDARPVLDAEGNPAKDLIGVTGGRLASYTAPGTPSSDVTVSTMNTGITAKFSFVEPTSKAQADAQNDFVSKIKTNGMLRIETGSADSHGDMPVVYTMEGYQIRDGYVYANGDLDNPIASYEQFGTPIAEKYDQKASITVEGGSPASYMSGLDASDTAHYPTKINGEDAEIELNGVTYTSSNNNFSINGLSIKALAASDDELTISTDTDSQAIYDKIKDFLTEYNSIINEMTKMYNAESAYGYEPLTDEEKDAMSDTEIEKWEEKIKNALLRNDTTLNGVMMSMINSMSASYEVNGTKYSLSTFGISTMGYLNAAKNENYAYHIAGDADDENTSGLEDKLMKAINENPDDLVEFFKQMTAAMYKNLGDKMKSTSLSSAYTIYNDKEMGSQYSEYSKTIASWQDKLSKKEDFYYKKFSQMESAMTKLQSQTSSLTGMFPQ